MSAQVIDLVHNPKNYPRFKREIPTYTRLTPEQIKLKIKLMCDHIRELGEAFTQEKLGRFEAIANLIVIDEIPFPEGWPVPTPRRPSKSRSATPLRGSGSYLKGASSRERDDDYKRVLFYLGDKWRVIVCAQEIQYVLQRKLPSQWLAKSYPTTVAGLKGAIRRHIGPEATVPEAFN